MQIDPGDVILVSVQFVDNPDLIGNLNRSPKTNPGFMQNYLMLHGSCLLQKYLVDMGHVVQFLGKSMHYPESDWLIAATDQLSFLGLWCGILFLQITSLILWNGIMPIRGKNSMIAHHLSPPPSAILPGLFQFQDNYWDTTDIQDLFSLLPPKNLFLVNLARQDLPIEGYILLYQWISRDYELHELQDAFSGFLFENELIDYDDLNKELINFLYH